MVVAEAPRHVTLPSPERIRRPFASCGMRLYAQESDSPLMKLVSLRFDTPLFLYADRIYHDGSRRTPTLTAGRRFADSAIPADDLFGLSTVSS